MGNKRVSQLVELTAVEVASDDLFLIIDSSAKESKKINITQLGSYLNVSGSIIAISATTADTASYILGSNVHGIVESASFAIKAISALSASWASSSISSSYSVTASFAQNVATAGDSLTSSYLRYLGFPNGTASYALTASSVNYAITSSHLLYSGVPNGTASFALSASWAPTSVVSASIVSASHANMADLADNAWHSADTDFLLYNGSYNGTASYAVVAGNIQAALRDYGIFLANTQSSIKAQLDSVSITPSTLTPQVSTIEAWGSINVPYTSSIITTGSLKLIALNLNSGEKLYLDSTPIILNISPGPDDWDTYTSGTITIPFSLAGQSTFSSSQYQVYVSGSPTIEFNSSRTTRFNVCSFSDTVTAASEAPLEFLAIGPSPFIISFTSTDGPGTFTDTLDGFNSTASYKITSVNVTSQSLTQIKYAWTLTSMSMFECNENYLLSSLPGMPDGLTLLSCSLCNLSTIASLSNVVSMSKLDCSYNVLTTLPPLPVSLSYLNCSSNNITTLPSMPVGSYILLANSNSISTVPNYWPDTLTTMSLGNNNSLTFISLPTSLSYFYCNSTAVDVLPNLPTSMSQVYLSNCSLATSAIDGLCGYLVLNNVYSGSLDITLNGVPSATALTDIATLQSRAWTVYYDSV